MNFSVCTIGLRDKRAIGAIGYHYTHSLYHQPPRNVDLEKENYKNS